MTWYRRQAMDMALIRSEKDTFGDEETVVNISASPTQSLAISKMGPELDKQDESFSGVRRNGQGKSTSDSADELMLQHSAGCCLCFTCWPEHLEVSYQASQTESRVQAFTYITLFWMSASSLVEVTQRDDWTSFSSALDGVSTMVVYSTLVLNFGLVLLMVCCKTYFTTCHYGMRYL